MVCGIKGNKYTGLYILGHTNITEIDEALDLLWRNDVDPKNVVMGFTFYGRSFTMANPDCSEPNGICRFSTAGVPGSCSDTAGILIYSEIKSLNGTLNVDTYYDPKSTVKYKVFDGTQWVSYDDEESFTDKKKFLSSRCLGGLIIWAVDQDDEQRDALTGLLGDAAMNDALLEGGELNNEEKVDLANEFSSFTGQIAS
jgi:chitinase